MRYFLMTFLLPLISILVLAYLVWTGPAAGLLDYPDAMRFMRSSGGALTYCVDGTAITIAVPTGEAVHQYDEVCRG